MPAMTVRSVGLSALLVQVPDTATAVALAQHLRQRWGAQVQEIVPGAQSVLVDGVGPHTRAIWSDIEAWTPAPAPAEVGQIVIPVRYDGADLSDVARHWGVSAREVVRRHTSTVFTAAFAGFAPGFAYLSRTPWPVPRRTVPRTVVPAGSVALADHWCGIYPRATPGGWQLIGQTEVTLWDLDREPPALLTPGTRVRFEEIT